MNTLKEKIHEKLKTMCYDDLYDAGVDTSYFPKEAQQVLKEYAETIANLKCNHEQNN